MQHDPESTDEELELVAGQPTSWEKRWPVRPILAFCATLDTGLDETWLTPSSQRIELVKLRDSNRRQNAPKRYGLVAMISTVYLHGSDEKKQVKEELMTETAMFRSKKINSYSDLAICYMSFMMY